MDHDQRFKQLLTTFFPEFLQLFFPQWADRFDLGRVAWLDKEAFTDPPRGERRFLDLVARVSVRLPSQGEAGESTEWLVLIHIEIEAEDRVAPLRRRMFDYWHALRQKHDLPVLSIGFYLGVGLDGLGWDEYREEFWGEEVVRFRYPNIGLPALDGEDYLRRGNPLAVALSALMRLPPERRLELGEEAWHRLQSEQNELRRYLLRECVAAYLPRDEAEVQVFEQRLLCSDDPGERTMTVHLFDHIRERGRLEGLQQGLQQGQEAGRLEGQRLALLRVLEKKFGPLTEATRQQVAAVSAERLPELLDAAVTAASLPEVGLSQ